MNTCKIIKRYLSVYTKGKYKYGETEYIDSSFDIRRTYLAGSLKEVVNLFGEQSVLIWTAMLLKKRVIVYGEDLVALLRVVRSIPIFVWHRQSWDQMRPYVNTSKLELEDLRKAGVYVAGFTKSIIKTQNDLYDLFLDIGSGSAQIAEHAKGEEKVKNFVQGRLIFFPADFFLTKYHKDLGNFLVSSAQSEEQNEQLIIKDLTNKTKEFIGKLEQLKVDIEGKRVVTLEALQQRKLPPGMDLFLYGVAQAEKLTV